MKKRSRPRDPEKTALGRRIKGLRKERRLTQETLAEKIGIDAKYLAAIEQGDPKANPTIGAIQKVAKGLGLSLPALFQEWGTEPTDKAPALRRQVHRQLMEMDARRLMDILRVVRALKPPK